jgi:hypothetical protein
MKENFDLVYMFLAGVDWERRQGDKPSIKVAIQQAIQTRDAEHCVQAEQGQGSVTSADTGIQIKSVK